MKQHHKENVYYGLEDVKHQLQLIQKDMESHLLELHTAERAETAGTSAVRQLETCRTLENSSSGDTDYLQVTKHATQFHTLISHFI